MYWLCRIRERRKKSAKRSGVRRAALATSSLVNRRESGLGTVSGDVVADGDSEKSGE